MDVSLKIAHVCYLLLLSFYLCSPAVGFPTGLITVNVSQQYLVSFSLPGSILYYSLQKGFKQVSVNTKSNRNTNIFKTDLSTKHEHCHIDFVNLCCVTTILGKSVALKMFSTYIKQ